MSSQLEACGQECWIAGVHPRTPHEVMEQLASPLEILGNLIFLTGSTTDNPEQVYLYMRMAEEQMAIIRRISAAVHKLSKTPTPAVLD